MKRLLIVEDDDPIRDVYLRTFVKAGYAVDAVVNGQEALQKVQTTTYDMILLDIMMPGIDGIEVLRELRAETSPACHTPVFMLTNLGQDEKIKEAFVIGADGYLLKAQLDTKAIVKEIEAFFAQQTAAS